MRRVLPAIALAAVVASASALAGAATGNASLRIVGMQPLAVHGAGFKAGERVRVTFSGSSVVVRRTTAGPSGGFTVSSVTLRPSRCDGFRVVATGARGSSAVLKRPPLPGCHTG